MWCEIKCFYNNNAIDFDFTHSVGIVLLLDYASPTERGGGTITHKDCLCK